MVQLFKRKKRLFKFFLLSTFLVSLEEKPLFTTGVYDCFLVERDILQLTT
jgi:hypothetical protein